MITMSNDRVCWHCGGYLIWDNDHNGEELGYESGSIVSLLHCLACNAQVQYLIKVK